MLAFAVGGEDWRLAGMTEVGGPRAPNASPFISPALPHKQDHTPPGAPHKINPPSAFERCCQHTVCRRGSSENAYIWSPLNDRSTSAAGFEADSSVRARVGLDRLA